MARYRSALTQTEGSGSLASLSKISAAGLVQTKRLGIGVVLLEGAVDGGLQIDDALEDAALQPTAGQGGEEALDGVEPGGGGWGEVEGPSGWRSSQALTFGCLWVA